MYMQKSSRHVTCVQGASHMPPKPGNIDEQLLQPDLDEDAVPLQRYASLTGRGGGWFSQTQARAPQLLLACLHKAPGLHAPAVATAWMLRPILPSPRTLLGALRSKWMAVPPVALLLSFRPAKVQSKLPAKQNLRLQLTAGTE